MSEPPLPTPKAFQSTGIWKRAGRAALSPKHHGTTKRFNHDANSTTPTNSDQATTPVASTSVNAPQPTPTVATSSANEWVDPEEAMKDSTEASKDPFVTAGFALIKHGALKTQLHELVEAQEARASSLLGELQLARQAQDETIKSSVTKRKLIASLREQVKEERQRRDSLLSLKAQQKHPTISALRQTLANLTRDREELEQQLQHEQGKIKHVSREIEQLRIDLEHAKQDATKNEQLGIRAAQRKVTLAEKDHRSDMDRWLSLLRGETDEDRKQRAKEKKVVKLPPGTQVNATVALLQRPDLLTKVGALGTGEELEQLLNVRDIIQENNRVERVYHLQQKRLEIAMQVLAPQLLEKQRERERQLRLEQQDKEVALSTLTVASSLNVTGGDASRSPLQESRSIKDAEESIEMLPAQAVEHQLLQQQKLEEQSQHV